MSRREEMRDPRCRHKRKGTVTAGDLGEGPHASTSVCDRAGCIADAKDWAETYTGLSAAYTQDPAGSKYQETMF